MGLASVRDVRDRPIRDLLSVNVIGERLSCFAAFASSAFRELANSACSQNVKKFSVLSST